MSAGQLGYWAGTAMIWVVVLIFVIRGFQGMRDAKRPAWRRGLYGVLGLVGVVLGAGAINSYFM